MSVSKDSSMPVLDDGFQHDEVLLAAYDAHGGVKVNMKTPKDPKVFHTALRASLLQWRKLGKQAVFLRLPIGLGDLTETIKKEGFRLYGSAPHYEVYYRRFHETSSTIRANATHKVGIKREASSIMSVSIDSSVPVLEDGFQHGELNSESYDDFGSVRMNFRKPIDPEVFHTALKASLLQWRKLGKLVWLRLHIGRGDLIETAEKEGFRLHHSEPHYKVYFHRFHETPSTIRANATHRVGIKREASGIMSVSIDSSVPVLDDGFQHGEVLLAAYDAHGGVKVNMKTPKDPKVFHTALRASLLQWRKQGKQAVFLHLPIGLGDLTETIKKEGFRLHGLEPHYEVYYGRFRETSSTIRANATHRVGIKREASSIMSVSIDSSVPVLEDGFQHGELNSESYHDLGSVRMNFRKPIDPEVFHTALKASLLQWRKLGKLVWLQLPISLGHLIETAEKEGFRLHRSEPLYEVYFHWFHETPSTIRANATHRVGIKREASGIMSVSIDSSMPVLDDGFQHDEVLLAAYDAHGGVKVNMKTPKDPKVFHTALRASLLQWRKQGKQAVFLHLPIGLGDLTETIKKEGFRLHGSEPHYEVYYRRFHETSSTIRANATHRVGIKREASGIMSVSIDSSVPVLDDGFRHGKLLSAAFDAHGGVKVNIKKPKDPKVFHTTLRASLLQWKKQGRQAVWLRLPIGLGDLTETIKKEGFRLHRSKPHYEVYFHRFHETPSTIRANATHRVGIKREMGGPTVEWIREKMEEFLCVMGFLVRKATTLEEKPSYQMNDIKTLMSMILRKIKNLGLDIYLKRHILDGLSLRQIYEELLAKYPSPFLKMEAPTRKPMEFWKWFSAAAIFKRKCQSVYSSFEQLFSAGSTSFDRKWEELDKDCLVEVFQKVGIEPLLFATSNVCKTWRAASLDPRCWEPHFPEHLVFSTTESTEFIVNRCSRHNTSIMLSKSFSSQAIEYIGNRCLALKSLGLYHPMWYEQSVAISDQISKWANLETVTLMEGCHMKKLLPQIGLHCKNFTELRAPVSYIRRDEASLIVTHLPKIKHLSLKGSTIERETLVMIMQGCKELVSLDVRDCTGFRADDAEILQLASHIPAFKCEGSRGFENHRRVLSINGVPTLDIAIDGYHFFHNF